MERANQLRNTRTYSGAVLNGLPLRRRVFLSSPPADKFFANYADIIEEIKAKIKLFTEQTIFFSIY